MILVTLDDDFTNSKQDKSSKIIIHLKWSYDLNASSRAKEDDFGQRKQCKCTT